MKTRVLLSAVLTACCLFMESCDSTFSFMDFIMYDDGDFEGCFSEPRKVDQFFGIILDGPVDVVYNVSDTTSVTVESKDEKDLSEVVCKVDQGVLEIGLKKGRHRNIKVRVCVCSPVPKYVRTAGSGDFISDDTIESGKCEFFCNGSGDIRLMSLHSGNATLSSKGSGDIIVIEALCDRLDCESSGSGDIWIRNAKADALSLKSKGSGDMEIHKLDAVSVEALSYGNGDLLLSEIAIDGNIILSSSGSGDILANGYARNINASTKGSGDISGKIKYDELSRFESGSGDIRL